MLETLFHVDPLALHFVPYSKTSYEPKYIINFMVTCKGSISLKCSNFEGFSNFVSTLVVRFEISIGY